VIHTADSQDPIFTRLCLGTSVEINCLLLTQIENKTVDMPIRVCLQPVPIVAFISSLKRKGSLNDCSRLMLSRPGTKQIRRKGTEPKLERWQDVAGIGKDQDKKSTIGDLLDSQGRTKPITERYR
jgi:hypothetical protein